MIAELVQFKCPAGMSPKEILEDAKTGIKRWTDDPQLIRKHYIKGQDDDSLGGFYIWTSKEAAQKGHNQEWKEGVKKKTGAYPEIRYFDFFMLVDNEKGTVTENP